MTFKSSCCNSTTYTHVDSGGEGTSFYVCNKCGKACDLKPSVAAEAAKIVTTQYAEAMEKSAGEPKQFMVQNDKMLGEQGEWWRADKYWVRGEKERNEEDFPRLLLILAEQQRRDWEEMRKMCKTENVKWRQPNPCGNLLQKIDAKLNELK